MKITAIFEDIQEYPPLHVNKLVNVGFNLVAYQLRIAAQATQALRHLGNAEYEFTGVVLRNYHTQHEFGVLIVEADGFRFEIPYWDEKESFRSFEPGQTISGKGTLTLDINGWSISDVPDCYYTFRVVSIREQEIPDSHIRRSEGVVSSPTWVPSSEVKNSREVTTMEEKVYRQSFFTVDYDDEGVGNQVIPPTAMEGYV